MKKILIIFLSSLVIISSLSGCTSNEKLTIEFYSNNLANEKITFNIQIDEMKIQNNAISIHVSFVLWNTEKDGSGKDYFVGQEININDFINNKLILYAMWETQNLQYRAIESGFVGAGGYAVSAGHAKDSRIYIPKVHENKFVTVVDSQAFQNKTDIVKIVMPETIIKIGNQAFWCCGNLLDIIIPDNVIEIGDDAFYHCVSLPEIKLPESILTIGERAFRFCIEIKIFEIPKNVKHIAFSTFSDCHELEKVILPEILETIGVFAFFNCYKLREINISSKITSIGDDAFKNTLIIL